MSTWYTVQCYREASTCRSCCRTCCSWTWSLVHPTLLPCCRRAALQHRPTAESHHYNTKCYLQHFTSSPIPPTPTHYSTVHINRSCSQLRVPHQRPQTTTATNNDHDGHNHTAKNHDDQKHNLVKFIQRCREFGDFLKVCHSFCMFSLSWLSRYTLWPSWCRPASFTLQQITTNWPTIYRDVFFRYWRRVNRGSVSSGRPMWRSRFSIDWKDPALEVDLWHSEVMQQRSDRRGLWYDEIHFFLQIESTSSFTDATRQLSINSASNCT